MKVSVREIHFTNAINMTNYELKWYSLTDALLGTGTMIQGHQQCSHKRIY